jgi:DNA-binding XRE family transcriptional regulator
MKSKLRELRNKRGFSQKALAIAANTSVRTIYSIEVENKNIHISLARKIANCLNCSVDDLYDFGDDAHSLTDKALWFVHVVRYTAELIDKPIRETTKLLEKSGLADAILNGYSTWHTQGFEYMAETLEDELKERVLI